MGILLSSLLPRENKMEIVNYIQFEHYLRSYMQHTGSWHEISKDFGALDSDYEKMDFVFVLLRNATIAPNKNVKSAVDTKKWLAKARASLMEEDKGLSHRQRALLECTKALMCAPLTNPNGAPSQEFKLALDLRSEILLQLSMFDCALADIEILLSYDLSLDEKCSVLERKGKCCEKLRKLGETINVYEEVVQICKTLKKDSWGFCHLINCAKSGLQKESKNKNQKSSRKLPTGCRHECEVLVLPAIPDHNPKFPSISSSLHVVHSSTGLNFIANRDIKPGEVVMIEDPLVCCYSDPIADVCIGCNKICWPLPTVVCHQCTKVLYCSEDCHKENGPKCHDIECPILEYFSSEVDGRQIVFMVTVLRTIIAVGLNNLYKLYNMVLDDPNLESWEYESEDYEFNAFVLMYKQKIKHGEDWAYNHFDNSVRAFFIVKLLEERTVFFRDTAFCQPSEMWSEEREDFRVFAASVIYRQLINMAYISVRIQEMIYNPIPSGLPKHVDQVRHNWRRNQIESAYLTVATGMYPLIGNLDHCCHPNTAIIFFGSKAIVKACRTIYNGEAVSVSRIGVDRRLSKEETDSIVSKYYRYDCKCVACLDNWSAISDKCDISKLCSFSARELTKVMILKEAKKAGEFHKKLRQFKGYIALKIASPIVACTCASYLKINSDLIDLLDRYTKKPNGFLSAAEVWFKCNMHYQGNHSCVDAEEFDHYRKTKSVATVRIDLTGPRRNAYGFDARNYSKSENPELYKLFQI